MINKFKNPKGFTLIETLIAVLLLATAIAGPLTIASKGLTATVVAKNQFTAFYLAQDAMEQVRFLRDSACLVATPGADGCPQANWLSALGPCTSTDGTASCTIDSLQDPAINPPIACGATCPTLYYHTTNKYFTYDTNQSLTKERFVRSIRIQHDPAGPNPNEAIVTVTVSWSATPGATRAPVTVRENIFRWQ